MFPDDPETKKKRETNGKLNEIWEHMIAACDDYIKRLSEAKIKNSNGVLIEYAARAYLEDKAPYDDDIFELAGVDEESEQYLGEDGDPDPDLITEDLLNTGTRKIFLYGIYLSYRPGKWNPPFRYPNIFVKSGDIDRFYELMKSLGYKLSTEEQQMLDGTHELYRKESSEDNDEA